jgi:hypothetical protein
MTIESDVEVLTTCPDCSVTGPDVYRAEAHPLTCDWMMTRANRCNEHDELLRPDESDCPFPDEDEESPDPHRRQQS